MVGTVIYRPNGMGIGMGSAFAGKATWKQIVEIEIVLRDEPRHLRFETHVTQSEFSVLLGYPKSLEAVEIVTEVLREMIDLPVSPSDIDRWHIVESVEPAPATPKRDRRRGVAPARSLLALANRVLPPEDREEALAEWVDEIETAADEGLSVRRRAISILLRSLPVMALRSRLPARVRGGGG
jgi:hypothetical protein